MYYGRCANGELENHEGGRTVMSDGVLRDAGRETRKQEKKGCDIPLIRAYWKAMFGQNESLEKLSITFTSNGKRELVPRDQVSSLLVVYWSLFLHLN